MKRKTKLMAVLTVVAGLSSFLSPTLNTKVYAADDDIAPILETVKIDKTSISKNESLTITVKGYDNGTGIAGGDLVLIGSNGDKVNGKLELSDPQTLNFIYRPSAFESTSGEYAIDSIELFDKAQKQNRAYFYAPEDYDFTSISVSGYDNIGEISGANRYDTAIEVSKYFNQADTVIIALGTDYPDALSAGPLSTALNAPILLTQKNNVSSNTLNEIKRLGATKAIILGGTSAISDDIKYQLKSKGIVDIQRISGKDRYATATAVGEYLFEIQKKTGNKSEHVVIASGNSFADALAASSMASKLGRPILLTRNLTDLGDNTKTFLKNEQIKYVSVIGGSSVISDKIIQEIKLMGIEVDRYAGSDRYETSSLIANKFFNKSTLTFVSYGQDFADALSAAPLAAMKSAPILLTNNTSLPPVIEKYLKNSPVNGLNHVTVVGGNSAVGDSVKKAMSQALRNR